MINKKMILENWQAIEEIENEVRQQTGDAEAAFNANLFFMRVRGLIIPVKYRKQKKNGSYTDKYFDINVSAKYCPFTGKPLYMEEEKPIQ